MTEGGESSGGAEGGPSSASSPLVPQIVIVTDPGPDPDDVKSITTSAIRHRSGRIRLHGVVCNGGEQALQRARLAKALLRYLGCDDIPVAVGSAGKPYEPQPHEYAFPGVEGVQESELHNGGELLLKLLEAAGPRSLTFLMISAMTDLADVMRVRPELVLEKVRHLCVMGGLHRTDDPQEWEPDTAVNNNWDMASAQLMYRFCFERGVPMSVVSRNAVPNLPMSLAKELAASEPNDPVMRYLVDAQELGLIGLWRKVCAGLLPPRCSKQWYFSTFCAVDAATFEERCYDKLGPETSIREYLNGHVKPYDVCALMFALEDACFQPHLTPEMFEAHGTTHRLYLEAASTVRLDDVQALLKSVFVEVIEYGRQNGTARKAVESFRPGGDST